MGTRTNFFRLVGGGTRDRTADLLHAMQALSQLSYTPVERSAHYREVTKSCKALFAKKKMNRVLIKLRNCESLEYQLARE